MRFSRHLLAAPLALALGIAATTALAEEEHHEEASDSAVQTGDQGATTDAGKGGGGMMDPAMMMRMHEMMAQMMGGGAMGGMMSGMGGGMMGGSAMRMLDADGDGTVSPDELETGLRQALATHDADGSGALSIEEFEAYHSALIRSFMVDRFQALDDDGDGQVTEAELAAPAQMMRRAMTMQATPPATGAGMMPGMGTGQSGATGGN